MTVTTSERSGARDGEERLLPRLENGDRLDQPTFHARYLAMPEGFRAELIEGIVFVPSPVARPHMRGANLVNHWLGAYAVVTPGTEALDAGTVVLGPESEPEPDAFLRLLPEYGGRTRVIDEYIHGAPELVVEVSSSSEAIDMHLKKDDYERAGVEEYLVVLLRQQEVRWFVLREGRYQPLEPAPEGILRSERFPGLWLDPQALLRGDARGVLEALSRGVASPEHQAWVTTLAGRAAQRP